MDFAALSHNALISFIVCHPTDNQAWTQFIQRFNLFIYATISRESKKQLVMFAGYDPAAIQRAEHYDERGPFYSVFKGKHD